MNTIVRLLPRDPQLGLACERQQGRHHLAVEKKHGAGTLAVDIRGRVNRGGVKRRFVGQLALAALLVRDGAERFQLLLSCSWPAAVLPASPMARPEHKPLPHRAEGSPLRAKCRK